MEQDRARQQADRALVQSTEPQERLGRSGFDPSRVEALVDWLTSEVDGAVMPAAKRQRLAETAAILRTLMAERNTYRGWTIRYDPPPIPVRHFDWTATHPDYDASWEGEETGWVDNGLKASAPTREELCEEIDALQDEWKETNGQFGVGA